MTTAALPLAVPSDIEAAAEARAKPTASKIVDARTLRIRELNDAFRATLAGGKAYFSPGVSEKGAAFSAAALAAVRMFTGFSLENDPYGEHDFGAFRIGDERLCWKIDYYDVSLDYGSRDPANPAQTTRVLTIMLAEEF